MLGVLACVSLPSTSAHRPPGFAEPAAASCCPSGFRHRRSTTPCLRHCHSQAMNGSVEAKPSKFPLRILFHARIPRSDKTARPRMSEPARAVASRPAPKPAAADPATNRVTELKVSGHLMTLEAGLFCVFQPPGSPTAGANGLPGVRLSLPPGAHPSPQFGQYQHVPAGRLDEWRRRRRADPRRRGTGAGAGDGLSGAGGRRPKRRRGFR